MYARNDDCTIGIIASPRQNGFQYSHPHQDRASPGTGANLFNRGKYQFTGHTAVFIKMGNEHKIVRGLVPGSIWDTIRGVLFGSTVHGKWQNDENLFHDKTSRITEISIPQHVAEKFNDYFENVSKEKLTQYDLSPESGTQGNCVYSALTILIDFMYEHKHLFNAAQWESLESQLNTIISDTAARGHCMQGHLVSNIEKWGGHFQFESLLNNIKEFLKTEIQRLENKHDKSAKLFVAKKILEDVIMLQSKKEIDEESINKIISRTQVFAYHKRIHNEPTSRNGWDKIKVAYNLNVKIAETSLYTLYFDYKQSSSLYEKDNNKTHKLKNVIKNLLRKKDSYLSLYLRSLNEEDKSKLIGALLSNNFDVLKNYLLAPLLGSQFDELKEYLEMTSKRSYSAHSLNRTVKKLIQEILKKPNSSSLAIKDKKRILQDAFKIIPDESIDVHVKAKMAFQIDKKAAKQISHFSYSPSYSNASPRQIRHTYIKESEFAAAVKQSRLEYSQFIVITLDLLQAKLGAKSEPKLLERLKRIRQFYLTTDYENAVAEIKTIVIEHQNALTQNLSELILEATGRLVEPDIHANYSRRFFENKLAERYMESFIDLHSIDKISSFLIGKEVNNTSQAQSAILDISHRHDTHALKRYKKLSAQSTLLKTRDRIKK